MKSIASVASVTSTAKPTSAGARRTARLLLQNQHVALEKPRVRSKDGREVKLQTYEDFQDPRLFEQAVFTEGIKRVSQRDYEKGVQKIANSFGFKKSQVSKRWVKTTAKKIEELQERNLSPIGYPGRFYRWQTLSQTRRHYCPWCSFRWPQIMCLAFFQADTENSASCIDLLNNLEKRGLKSTGPHVYRRWRSCSE